MQRSDRLAVICEVLIQSASCCQSFVEEHLRTAFDQLLGNGRSFAECGCHGYGGEFA